MFSPSRWCPNIAGCSICCQSSKQPAPANFFYGKNVWPTKKISSHPNSNLARDQSWKSWRVCMYIYIERPFVGNKKRVSTSQCRRQPSLGSITVKSLLWWREHIATHILIPQTFLNKGEGRVSGNSHYLKPLLHNLDLVWLNFELENKWSLRPCQTFYTFFYFEKTYRPPPLKTLKTEVLRLPNSLLFFSSSGKWVQIDLVTLLRGDLQSGMTSFK